MNYREIEGDLIKLALEGEFDVIAHGCNCFCTQRSGIAKAMVETFGTNKPVDFGLESLNKKGDINKLGSIDFCGFELKDGKALSTNMWGVRDKHLTVVNCYTQYRYGKNNDDGQEKPIDYEALQLCFKKLNHIFKGKKIGLPLIGCGLAGGRWSIVKKFIQGYLADCDVTVVIFK